MSHVNDVDNFTLIPCNITQIKLVVRQIKIEYSAIYFRYINFVKYLLQFKLLIANCNNYRLIEFSSGNNTQLTRFSNLIFANGSKIIACVEYIAKYRKILIVLEKHQTQQSNVG